MADADGDQLDGRAHLDLVDHVTQVLLQIAAGVDGKGRVVDRRAVTITDPTELAGAMTDKLVELFEEKSREARPRFGGRRRHLN